MSHFIDNFVTKLSNQRTGVSCHNFYKTDATARHNLTTYLHEMQTLQPSVLLIGEAPGYSGCARTGIPFTTGKELQHAHCNNQLLSLTHDYRRDITYTNQEQSALCIYQSLNQLSDMSQKNGTAFTPPLIWNIFAFHPHVKYRRQTNRKPTQKEIDTTFWSLEALIDAFDIQTLIAVGATASKQLERHARHHLPFRHPAYGGCALFRTQLFNFYALHP